MSIFKDSDGRLHRLCGSVGPPRVAASGVMADRAPRPDCLHCQHFFVTWDAQQPRGCRAYGFKSNDLPSDVVFASSGAACQLFERKPDRKPPGKLLR